MKNRVICSALTALAMAIPSACTESKASTSDSVPLAASDTITPVATKSGPDPIAGFFAATKVTGQCPNDTTCVYVQTFLNGATREITIVVSPNRKAPAGSTSAGEFGNAPLSGFQMSKNLNAEPQTVNLNYYVGAAGLSNTGRRSQMMPRRRDRVVRRVVSFGDQRYGTAVLALASAMQAGGSQGGGAGIAWGEIGKSGADAGIGAVIDAAKDKGIKIAPGVGSIYELASALNDVSSALELGQQNTRWLKELDALEKCAGDPSNPVSRSDPNYSSRTVAKIQAARSELKEVNSVRFLNQMTETATGLTPVTAVMGVGLKQGFQWSDQTLGDYSENTIMREARVAVVKCEDPGNPTGNLDYVYTCGNGRDDITVTHIVADVSWVWQMGIKYFPKGKYKFSAVRTIGPTCRETMEGEGTIAAESGYLFIFDDPERQKELGYGYEARIVNWNTPVTRTTNCGVPGNTVVPIDDIPTMHGYRAAGGNIEGTISGNACSPGTLKWSFTVPAGK